MRPVNNGRPCEKMSQKHQRGLKERSVSYKLALGKEMPRGVTYISTMTIQAQRGTHKGSGTLARTGWVTWRLLGQWE